LLVTSAYAGTLEGYRLDDGERVWPQPRAIGRGVTDLTLVGDKIAAADPVHNRLLLLDPSGGTVLQEIRLDGAPRALAPMSGGLLVGLDTAAKVVRFDSVWRQRQIWKLRSGAGQ
jgi:hypothetical protein